MSGSGSTRIVTVDVTRGLAIVGMVVFHLAWDLHAWGWSGLDPSAAWGWTAFGHLVASMFLFLSGFGLVLARTRGEGMRQAVWRIGRIAVAAAGITLVTAIAMPTEPIWFGVLHCIALGNLLALLLLDMPPATLLFAAAGSFILPALVAGHAPASWWWLGLSSDLPPSVDVRPLFPWFSVILLGVWAGRTGLARWLERADGAVQRLPIGLSAAGRHSLSIYLAHQPLLYGLFWLLAAAGLAPAPAASPGAADFGAACRSSCVRSSSPEACDLFCTCARSRLEQASPGREPTPDVIDGAAKHCGVGSDPLELHSR